MMNVVESYGLDFIPFLSLLFSNPRSGEMGRSEVRGILNSPSLCYCQCLYLQHTGVIKRTGNNTEMTN